jgi:hypothetical protein
MYAGARGETSVSVSECHAWLIDQIGALGEAYGPQGSPVHRIASTGCVFVVWLLSSAALAVADVLMGNLIAQGAWVYFAATAVAGVLGLLFRPALTLVATWIAPGITASFWSAFWASWVVAGVGSATALLTSAGTDDSFTA